MEVLYYLIIVGTLLICTCDGGDLDYDGKLTVRLDHQLDSSETSSYFHRGDVFIKSLYSGTATVEEFNLTKEQIRLLKDLAKKGGNYRLRATAKTSDGKENYYYTFVKACSLIESLLTNVLTVNLDHNGNVIAVSMVVPNKCVGAEVKSDSLINFNTSIEVRHMELGPVPDTATYIQKLEKEREAMERAEAKDNRSFFGKYWIYIIPALMFMFVLIGANPESAAAAQR